MPPNGPPVTQAEYIKGHLKNIFKRIFISGRLKELFKNIYLKEFI